MNMFLNVFQTIISIFSVQVLAFIDFGNGQEALEMIQQGKNQYQLMEERGRLPKYGECWKAAIEHVHEGCRYLSEETQSDIALHITNCFLSMSGHESYNCELDRKPNLRGICISSMSDRAFNVYTEFYTHTQNICWFLRGQVWQEKITENTIQVTKQLKNSISQQDTLLKQQKQSLEIQDRLLKYGISLERVLNESRFQALQVVEEIRASTVKHQQLLTVMADSLGGLKSWLIGELSWFDSLIFYLSSGFIILVLTSTKRTSSSRLPLLLTLSFNILLERTICDRLTPTNDISGAHTTHESVQIYIWYCRRLTIFLCTITFFVLSFKYRDYAEINNSLLLKIQEQNDTIKEALDKRMGNERTRERSESYTDISEISKKEWNRTPTVTSSRANSRMRYTPDVHRTYNLRNRLTPMKNIPNQDDFYKNNNNNSHA